MKVWWAEHGFDDYILRMFINLFLFSFLTCYCCQVSLAYVARTPCPLSWSVWRRGSLRSRSFYSVAPVNRKKQPTIRLLFLDISCLVQHWWLTETRNGQTARPKFRSVVDQEIKKITVLIQTFICICKSLIVVNISSHEPVLGIWS